MMRAIVGRGVVVIFSVGIMAVQASGQTAITFTASNVETPASRLVAIEFGGISPEAEQQIRSLLQLREGDTIGPSARDRAQSAVQGFDSRLNASFIIRNGTDTTLHIGPGWPAGPSVRAAAPAAYPLGAGIMSPIPTYLPDPQYPNEETRKAHWQGIVLVSAVIDETGTPRNMTVVRPPGLGLDEKAIEAASQWKFKPGTKDGVPVPVPAQLAVFFRLP
jgi:TonB family protein